MVKKFLIVLLSGLVFLISHSSVHAEFQEDRAYFVGEIISVNVKDNTITIYDYTETVKRTFYIENGVGKDLKPGVEVMVSVLKGTNTAKRVKLIVSRSLEI